MSRIRTVLLFIYLLQSQCAWAQSNTVELYIPGRDPSSSDETLTASLIGGSGSPTSTFLLTAGESIGDGSNDETPSATTAQVISTQTADDGSAEIDIIGCQVSSEVSNCVATRIISDSSGQTTTTFGFNEVASPVTVVAVGFTASVTTLTQPQPSSPADSPGSASVTTPPTMAPPLPSSTTTSPQPGVTLKSNGTNIMNIATPSSKTAKILFRNISVKSHHTPHEESVTVFEKTEEKEEENIRVASSSKTLRKRITSPVSDAKPSTIKLEDEIEDIIKPQTPQKPKRNTRKRKETTDADGSPSPRKSKTIRLALDTPHPPPHNWEKVYSAIKEMRKNGGAPVDEMGCHMAGGPVEDPKTKRFVILISLMLSSQTKDEVTHVAVKNLRTALGELTPENLAVADDSVISNAIEKVGFWRRKTQYIKQAARKILDEFGGEIPDTLEGLCSLSGVGPKMAFLALQVAWNRNEGIGVDVHVHRITNRLGWHKPPTKDPEQTRLNLQSWLPKDLHTDINPLLVGFGQTICLPVGPRCDACTLSNDLCPSAVIKPKSRTRGRLIAKVNVEIEDDKQTVEKTIKAESEAVDIGNSNASSIESLVKSP
ncbi:hypothetical protein Clacol_006080 [Clathrus columnatus]|uniref:Endonuclease III homolog n=1 Tax=Clathrus columnatus TaxID=1419009 RepID=A0AAV5ADQ5_9AGAM|nr:hypothetical protein Clacol_006080 [Clathrus columnatus]